MARPRNEVELIGGQEKRDIVIVEYDPVWVVLFEEHAGRIRAALGATAIRVDHVGSTAVPGLPAKPIVDIDLSVPDVEQETNYLPALDEAGYRLRVHQAGHRMVRTATLDVQVHICSAGSDWERRHLLFRDWLRHDHPDRAAYAALKTRLAKQEWEDMNQYAEAKSELIAEITARAECWAADGGWRAP